MSARNHKSGIPRRSSQVSRQQQAQAASKHRRFHTNFCRASKLNPPPTPPSLLKVVNQDEYSRKKDNAVGPGRVKVMLRVCPNEVEKNSRPTVQEKQLSNSGILTVCENNKIVEIIDPSSDLNSAHRRMGVTAPKLFSFDAVFSEDACQSEISNSCLPEVIQSVILGADGAVFCYGHAGLGKTHTIIGQHRSTGSFGLIPHAISWLYKAIEALNQRRKNKYCVRVSALELSGKGEELNDLLAEYSKEGAEVGRLHVEEDPLFGTQIQNLCELRASTVEKAAFLLDAALGSRSTSKVNASKEVNRHSHFVFTLHVYHYKYNQHGKIGASSGRSRLHFIDIGSCERTLVKTPTSLILSLNSLGHVIMGIINNSKHVPFKESKLTSVLRELLGNFNCRTVMIAHVSRSAAHYADTLSTIQMASRIHRVLIKRKSKTHHVNGKLSGYGVTASRNVSSSGRRSDDSLGTSSGIEGTSGSELSCDTVIYVRPNGTPYSDKELTDNEGPPLSVPVDVRPLENIKESKSLTQALVHADANKEIAHIRQEPDGCDFDKNSSLPCVNLSKYIEELENALSALDQSDICVSHQTTYDLNMNEGPRKVKTKLQRNTRMNKTQVAKKETCLDESDDSEVEVNFYCLSFTTNRNGLVPLSKTALAKQVQSCKKDRSSTSSNEQDSQLTEGTALTRSQTFIIEPNSNKFGEREVLSSEANSTLSSPSQVIVYDSSSLELNFVKPKSKSIQVRPPQPVKPSQKLQCNNISHVNTNGSRSGCSKSRSKCFRSKGIKSKSDNSINPKLSLVKKSGRDSPLELVITESQKTGTNGYTPTSKNTRKIGRNILAAPSQTDNVENNNSKLKLRWNGLKKFGLKKSGTSCQITNDICFSRCATDVEISTSSKQTGHRGNTSNIPLPHKKNRSVNRKTKERKEAKHVTGKNRTGRFGLK